MFILMYRYLGTKTILMIKYIKKYARKILKVKY